MQPILTGLEQLKEQNSCGAALLIDPDHCKDRGWVANQVQAAREADVKYIFYGGSLLSKALFEDGLAWLKSESSLPVVIFPGSAYQVSSKADAILFLSLISGRNAEFLIGQQVLAAPEVARAALEVIPTGYMLVDCGTTTTAIYVSGSTPLPRNKPELAECTGLAGKFLGLRVLYLDGGSGAAQTVHPAMVSRVSTSAELPLIVGGGINSAKRARELCEAGANLLVIGSAAEANPNSLFEITHSISQYNEIGRYIEPN